MASDNLPTEFAPAERLSPEEIQKQAAYFEHSDGLTRHVIDSIPNIFVILNTHRQIVYVNEAVTEALKIPPERACGKRPGELLNCMHSAGGCGTTEFCSTCGAVEVILSSLKGQKLVRECRIMQYDGNALDLRVWGTPLAANGSMYSIFVLQDISDEKRRRALERLFFHNILNVAGVVIGFAELIKSSSKPSDMVEYSDILSRATLRLTSEIQAQRDLSAAEHMELGTVPTALSTTGILREMRDFYSMHEAGKERQIVIAEDAEDAPFVSDETLIKRVIGNMVKNALEASRMNQTVTLACHLDGEYVVFSVHNPTDMPRDVQLQLFQRSFSTKGSGRGLGTYSMKLLSERYLQGHIWFETTPDNGTTFYARYPLMLDI